MGTIPDRNHDASATTTAIAALAALLLLDVAMFAAMLAGVAPHPAGARGPFIAASAAMALACLILVAGGGRAAGWMALLTALAFVPGVGPHKFFTEPAAPDLAPLIVVGSAALLALAWAGLRLLQRDAAPRCVRSGIA